MSCSHALSTNIETFVPYESYALFANANLFISIM